MHLCLHDTLYVHTLFLNDDLKQLYRRKKLNWDSY